MELVRLIKTCLKETYSKVRISKYLSDTFHIQNGLKEGDTLSTFLLNSALEYAIRKVQAIQGALKLNATHQFLVYADDVNLLGESIHTINRNTDASLESSMEVGLQVNAETTKYMFMSREHNTGKLTT
jgi:hypothetical protein